MNEEHREAARVERYRRMAAELDVDFQLLMDGDPNHTMCVITGPIYMADIIMERTMGL